MRFVTTPQLARLAFNGSVWAARKRLRRLLDAGLIRCWVRRLDAPNVYALTPRGARVLGEPAPDGRPWSAPRGLDGRLDHVLAVNALRVAFAATLGRDDAELVWWRSDDELARDICAPVIPDGLFEIRWPDHSQIFALEVDRTPPAPRAFARKLFRYQALPDGTYGRAGFVILIVGGQARWVERALLAARDISLHVPIWFAPFAMVETHGAYAAWRSPLGGIKPSLRAVAAVGNVCASQSRVGSTP